MSLEAKGKTEAQVFKEALEQIKYAEEMGFDCVWFVEHHFLEDLSRSSAPEVFLAAVSQHTKKIRIGHGVCLMPPPYSHPFRIAERIAALDIVSGGRVEFGCGRSVTGEELGGFGVNPADAREMMVEAMGVVPKMWRDRVFPGHKGKHIDVPSRVVVPKPIQKPHPPMWMACTSEPSFAMAGEMGVGCLSFTSFELELYAERVKAYRKAIKNPKPIGDFVNEEVTGFTVLLCDEDNETARKVGGPEGVDHYGRTNRYFGNVLSQPGYKEYAHVSAVNAEAASGDFDRVERAAQWIDEGRMCIGDPDACEAIVRRYQSLGADQFIGLVQFSEVTHEQAMKTIRLMGEKVMPRFR